MAHGFIPVADVCSVELIFGALGQVIENVFHVYLGAPASGADIIALRGVFDSWHNVTMKGQIQSGVVLNRIRTKALDTGASPMEDYSLPTPRAGSFAGVLLPLNATKSIKLQSGLAGRSYRGRFYWPGLSTTQVSGQTVLAANLTAMINSITTLQTNLTAANAAWKLCVVSYRTGGSWRVIGAATAITGAVAVTANVDSMRRRLTGRGR